MQDSNHIPDDIKDRLRNEFDEVYPPFIVPDDARIRPLGYYVFSQKLAGLGDRQIFIHAKWDASNFLKTKPDISTS